MLYYEKYIKYKLKYEHLKNQIGGGKQSALDLFLARFDDNVRTILLRDRERGFLNFDDIPSKENVPLLTNIFEQIYTKVNKDNKNIDWIIKSYINNTFGRPSSLENFGRFTQTLAKYKLLTTNIDRIKSIADINGLLELEDFIDYHTEYEYFTCIEAKKTKQKRRDERNRKEGPIRNAGIDDKKVVLETDKIIIYVPLTEAGSKYYGQETTWCTTAAFYCQFDYYNSFGKLYIIQSKSDSKLKFQLHVEKDQLMDPKDNPVTIDFVKGIFSDETLNNWLDGILEKTMINNYMKTKKLVITNTNLFKIDATYIKNIFSKVHELSILEDLTWNYNVSLNDLLKDLTNLQSLTFGNDFNNGDRSMTDILNELLTSKSLTSAIRFNNSDKPLNDSLNSLTNLKSLTFGNSFDQPLGNSLNSLTNLKSLIFGNKFNQPLGNLLNSLTNLELLEFGGDFDQPLGNSLNLLTNLQTLIFGDKFTNGNEPLGDLLKSLSNLQSLTFGSYFNNNNQPLNDSLINLTELKTLKFGMHFTNGNKPLGNSLKGLTKLESLKIRSNFNNGNEPLGDSLKDLTNLQYLSLGLFNGPLGNSLKGLTNLKELHFNTDFNNRNQPLGDSLKGLTNLESLYLGFIIQPLDDLLKDLPNLKILNGDPYP